MSKKPKIYILPTIIIAQFFCTSLWFAGNTVIGDLPLSLNISDSVGYLLSSVQLGFIFGTLVFAMLMIADRYKPSVVFMISALLGSICNLVVLKSNASLTTLLLARFATGFFLAGIYPVGMKIAADYYKKGLGKALGFLVGALVLGTALPHFIKGLNYGNYTTIIKTTSLLAILGGALVYFLIPNGPYRQKSKKLQLQAGIRLFKIKEFKKAAFGYFGHMWELYAFWAFIPFVLKAYKNNSNVLFSIPFWSFTIIAVGFVACIIGGYFSEYIGSKKVALVSLSISGICCLISPLLFHLPFFYFIGIWCIWGMAVIADSPQFSTLVASTISPKLKGTALTLVNCIGFTISIISIQLISFLSTKIPYNYLYVVLSLGPIIGIVNLVLKKK